MFLEQTTVVLAGQLLYGEIYVIQSTHILISIHLLSLISQLVLSSGEQMGILFGSPKIH